MTLKQIEYFQAVCARGSISAAAEALFISRSVVSRAISELEEEFQVQIFQRSKNGVTLTEGGKILARLFTSFTASCSSARSRIAALQAGKESWSLRLGVTATNAYCVYHTCLEAFQAQYPHIQLQIEEYSAYAAMGLLQAGKLDAFFTPVRPDPADFESLELYPNPAMLGVREDDPLAGEDSVSVETVLELPLGFFNAPVPVESLLHTCATALGKEVNVLIRTSDQVLLRELTQQGRIYPILPLDMMVTWEGIRQLPLDFVTPGTNRLVWSRAVQPSPPMEAFLSFMAFMK